MRIGQIILSSDLKVIGMNEYARKLFGSSTSDLGKSLYDYHPRRSHPKIDYIIRQSRQMDSQIPLAMVLDVMGKVLLISFSRIEMVAKNPGHIFSMTFIDVSNQTGAAINPASGAVEFTKLPVWHKNAFVFLEASSVYYFESDGNYCRIVTRDGSFHLQITLKSILQRYTGSSFFRIHRSYIVNLNNVRKLKLSRAGRYRVVFDSDKIPELPVARRRLAELKRVMSLP